MSRPRGFIENWTPAEHVSQLVGNVASILDDNEDILPLTLRQIFYMLVTGYAYPKDEKAYKRLIEAMNKARRARMIPMHSIRDDGLTRKDPFSWDSEEELISSFTSWADDFVLPRQRGQDQFTMVWCEAGGMVPQLARYCQDYGVPVLSSGGFDSLTSKHGIAKEIANRDVPTVVLHIGDHDPSGVHMHSSLDEDVRAFLEYFGGQAEFRRIAVTPDQVRELNLPTAPPKSTDKRSFSGQTTQAEALPPRKLKEIVQEHILDLTDEAVLAEIIDEEIRIRDSLRERLEDL